MIPTARLESVLASWRRQVGRVTTAGLLAGLLTVLATASASAGGSGATIYVHVATKANTHAYWTELDNQVSNGHPQTLIFVTANRTPGGVVHPLDRHQVGVVYHVASHKWAIFNEDHAPMPVGAAFDVYAVPPFGGPLSIHTATTANSAFDYTNVDNPVTNGQPTHQLFVTPNRSPNGSLAAGADDAHPVGVWYNGGAAKWSIFHEDTAPEVIGSSYNVYDATGVSALFLHTANASNTSGDRTCMDNAFLNNHPGAKVFVTQNWNPGGAAHGTYNPHPVAVEYNPGTKRWCALNANGGAVPLGASFNVFSA